MAKLMASTRNSMPSSEFGMPGSRKYPMPDMSHAANAKARATQMVAKGKLSPAIAAKIRAKANKVLGCFVVVVLLSATAWAGPLTFQVTIGASATQLSTTNLYCSAWIIQNNAAHNFRFGDSTTTTSKGTVLASGSPGGSYTTTASANGTQPAPDNLSQWYVAGTNGDVVDVTCKVVNF